MRRVIGRLLLAIAVVAPATLIVAGPALAGPGCTGYASIRQSAAYSIQVSGGEYCLQTSTKKMSVHVWVQRCSAWTIWGACLSYDNVRDFGWKTCNGAQNSCYSDWYSYTGTGNNRYRTKANILWDDISQGDKYSDFIYIE
jgi:hypothetical protein